MALKSFIRRLYWTVRPKYKIITWFTICYLFTINVKEYNFLKSNYVKMLLINGISCPLKLPSLLLHTHYLIFWQAMLNCKNNARNIQMDKPLAIDTCIFPVSLFWYCQIIHFVVRVSSFFNLKFFEVLWHC